MTNERAIEILNSLKDYYNDRNVDSYVGFDDEDNKAIDMAIKVLEQQPKTGKWEYVQYDYNPNIGNWHCSECRNIVIECVNKNDKGGIPIYKYCPNCGAKMEGEE